MTHYADPLFDRDLHALYTDAAPSVPLSGEVRDELEALGVWHLWGAALTFLAADLPRDAAMLNWYVQWTHYVGPKGDWYAAILAHLARASMRVPGDFAREYLLHARYLWETLASGTHNERATRRVKVALAHFLDILCST